MYSFLRIKDARYFQIIFQTLFLLYGIFYLHWVNEGICFLYYAASCIATQFSFELIRNKFSATGEFWSRSYNGCKSALITAFGLCLLLKTNLWYICILAGFISIAGKYIFHYRKKHLFNPSALGIALTILLTGNAWISPGQWGNDIVIIFGVCCLGFIVVTKVQKLDISIAFFATYILLLFIRQVLYLGWPLDFFIQSITTGSLLLFTFFMISDPKTAPDHKIARIIWAVLIGALSFYLTAFKFINAAPVWVLVFSAPLVPLLDIIFKAKRFQWTSSRLLQGQTDKLMTAS
ncbi:MAG TPA: RnfABCDGE type electron transport complex subunit D [Chitinophagaceae bacterium]|nr:RnfABCDGE type electron transport complex subunit D [Chitinophagaceae bacterium]